MAGKMPTLQDLQYISLSLIYLQSAVSLVAKIAFDIQSAVVECQPVQLHKIEHG